VRRTQLDRAGRAQLPLIARRDDDARDPEDRRDQYEDPEHGSIVHRDLNTGGDNRSRKGATLADDRHRAKSPHQCDSHKIYYGTKIGGAATIFWRSAASL